MKKIYKITSSLVLIFVLVFSFGVWNCGPTPPWNYNDVIWYSETPFIEVENSSEKSYEGVMRFNGKEQEICLLWGPAGGFEIIDQTQNIDGVAVDTITIINGWVEYDKDTATLIIERDDFFNYEYEEIVLKRRNIQ